MRVLRVELKFGELILRGEHFKSRRLCEGPPAKLLALMNRQNIRGRPTCGIGNRQSNFSDVAKKPHIFAEKQVAAFPVLRSEVANCGQHMTEDLSPSS